MGRLMCSDSVVEPASMHESISHSVDLMLLTDIVGRLAILAGRSDRRKRAI